jgi:hypothetical protein
MKFELHGAVVAAALLLAGCGAGTEEETAGETQEAAQSAVDSDQIGTSSAALSAPNCISRKQRRDFKAQAEYAEVRNNCGYGPIRVQAFWWGAFPSNCVSLRAGQSARLYGNGISTLAGISYCN